MGVNHDDHGFGNGFLGMIPKAQTTKETDKQKFIKTERFSIKDTVKKVNDPHGMRENICSRVRSGSSVQNTQRSPPAQQQKDKRPNLKVDKGPESTFLQRKYAKDGQAQETQPMAFVTREMQAQPQLGPTSPPRG